MLFSCESSSSSSSSSFISFVFSLFVLSFPQFNLNFCIVIMHLFVMWLSWRRKKTLLKLQYDFASRNPLFYCSIFISFILLTSSSWTWFLISLMGPWEFPWMKCKCYECYELALQLHWSWNCLCIAICLCIQK